MRNVKVLIAVPVYQHCETETMQSVYELKIPAGVEARLHFQKGYTVAQARNLIVKKSLKEKFDYTFFVDGDMVLPDYALQNLLAMREPVAAGWYVKKIPGVSAPEIYIKNGGGNLEAVAKVPRGEKTAAAAAGFGCVLVDNNVFRSLGKDGWFEYVYRKDGFVCSEDINFCLKAGEKGYKIFVDTNLCCGHIGRALYVPGRDVFERPENPEKGKQL